MARDPQELRRFQATVPPDLDDPPRFAQPVETIKDAFVTYLRRAFEAAQLNDVRRAEAPTVEKYAFGSSAAPGYDPYETYTSIFQEFPDVLERLPHIAVTSAGVTDRPRNIGSFVVSSVQDQPRVETGAGPFAFAEVRAQVVVVTVASVPAVGDPVELDLDGNAFFYTTEAGDDERALLEGLRRALVDAGVALDYRLEVSVVSGVPRLTLTARDPSASPTVTGSADLTVTVSVTSGGGSAVEKVVFRTEPGPMAEAVLTPVYLAGTFFADPTAATAAELATAINTYARGRIYAFPTADDAVRVSTEETPNAIEVDVTSDPGPVAALALAETGTAAPGDGFSGFAPDMTFTVAGAAFTAALVGRYLVVQGSAQNDGRWLVTSVPSATELVVENEDGQPETVGIGESWSWFIGLRDSWLNPARPPMLRYEHAGTAQVVIDILAESPNVRRELADLVWSFLTFFSEETHRTLHGRGVFSADYPDEAYQVIFGEATSTGDQDFAKGEDVKDRVYVARVTLSCQWSVYVDRTPGLPPEAPASTWADVTTAQESGLVIPDAS